MKTPLDSAWKHYAEICIIPVNPGVTEEDLVNCRRLFFAGARFMIELSKLVENPVTEMEIRADIQREFARFDAEIKAGKA